MTVTDQVLQLSTKEKLKIMEMLWVDLSRDEDAYESPEWHSRELKETRQRLEGGEEEILNWDEAKERLRNEAR